MDTRPTQPDSAPTFDSVVIAATALECAAKLRPDVDAPRTVAHGSLVHLRRQHGILQLLILQQQQIIQNTVVEAMSCGIFCVVTDVGDCRAVVDRFGAVCYVGDHEGIAAALKLELDTERSPEEKEQLRNYMYEEFSFDKKTEMFEAVFKEALSNKGRHG